jgi:hypothetical protein
MSADQSEYLAMQMDNGRITLSYTPNPGFHDSVSTHIWYDDGNWHLVSEKQSCDSKRAENTFLSILRIFKNFPFHTFVHLASRPTLGIVSLRQSTDFAPGYMADKGPTPHKLLQKLVTEPQTRGPFFLYSLDKLLRIMTI